MVPGQALDVLVVGSANLDVVLRVPRVPRTGETLLAGGRDGGPGGKGANQASAAARAGARTALLAAVGDDEGAAVLRRSLRSAGVQLELLRTAGMPTGTAYVLVGDDGDNAIVVDSGANAGLERLTAAELEAVGAARAVLCQLEVPLPTVEQALRAATGLAVLNAAPSRPLPDGLLEAVDVLVVNEQEALEVAGADDVPAAVAALAQRVPEVVVTLGAAGALLARRGQPVVQVPGVPARRVVDTTGAGDVLCGALTAARVAGEEPAAALALACAAASLSVERPGAGGAAPTLEQARVRLAEAARG